MARRPVGKPIRPNLNQGKPATATATVTLTAGTTTPKSATQKAAAAAAAKAKAVAAKAKAAARKLKAAAAKAKSAAGTAATTTVRKRTVRRKTAPTTPVTPVLTRVSLTPPTATVAIGAAQQLTAAAVDQNGAPFTAVTFGYSSGNGAVATVSVTGLVVAVAAGTATITVTAHSGITTATATATITVPAPTPAPKPAKSWWKKWWVWGIVAAIVVAALLIAAWICWPEKKSAQANPQATADETKQAEAMMERIKAAQAAQQAAPSPVAQAPAARPSVAMAGSIAVANSTGVTAVSVTVNNGGGCCGPARNTQVNASAMATQRGPSMAKQAAWDQLEALKLNAAEADRNVLEACRQFRSGSYTADVCRDKAREAWDLVRQAQRNYDVTQ